MASTKYPDFILRCVRQNLEGYVDLGPFDDSRDDEIDAMEPSEVWERYLTWSGFLGYGSSLHAAHEAIFSSNKSDCAACKSRRVCAYYIDILDLLRKMTERGLKPDARSIIMGLAGGCPGFGGEA